MLTRSSLTFVVALGVTGCASTNYQPANSPRVSVASDGIHKNGKVYKDPLEALADNPRALEEARTAQSLVSWGNGFILGGSGLIVAGAATAIAGGKNGTTTVTGLSLMLGGFVADIVGIILASNATPHAVDALNIYNDDVEAKMFIRRPAPAPTGTPATPTPQPR
jgi:hypothetical protein